MNKGTRATTARPVFSKASQYCQRSMIEPLQLANQAEAAGNARKASRILASAAGGSQSGNYRKPLPDGLSDPAEIETHRTNPNLADTDNDGLRDGEEFEFRYSSKYCLTRSGCGVGLPQHTRQASVRKDTLNTGGFFVPARERKRP